MTARAGGVGVEVVVFQHGEKRSGPGNPGLTARGRVQAARAATWLKDERIDVAAVWTSPLRRARETAVPIAEAAGRRLRADPRLRERMNWDGVGFSAEEFLAEWRRASADRSYVPVVGDSSAQAGARFLEAVSAIGGAEPDGAHVAVVSHGGVVVDSLRTLLGDDEVARRGPGLIDGGVPSGAVTRLRVVGGAVHVVGLPSTAHLGRPGRPRGRRAQRR